MLAAEKLMSLGVVGSRGGGGFGIGLGLGRGSGSVLRFALAAQRRACGRVQDKQSCEAGGRVNQQPWLEVF